MALIQKTLFGENLDRYNTFVQDTDTNSKYFKITELPDTLTGGKNAFLIQGSEYLVADTLIKIELKDASGNIIYHEPGEGYFSSSLNDESGKAIITEYYEGVSKVVAVYVYPETAFGPCTLTILGELSEYDNNGLRAPVPLNWQGQYNVKWQKQINVNPSLANTTKIRFYQRPQVVINEIISPIFRIENGVKINSGINQSFANIKLSKLETFAGDVKRVKVFRTSQGDISDFDLIQDILVESKELLTTTQLSGSVVGNTGIFTSETLKNFWNTGSLNAQLTSSRVESGVRLTGNGNFRYSSSLDLKSANTYELNLDAFYSSSTSSNLGIYISGSDGGDILISTLNGITPTKNLSDTVIPFKLDSDFQSGSLYFSQSQGEWHLGNISLRLSEDTAFSPDEISFITTMPTVIGNETYNFKFEFYDVNNNFVPVLVTGSANFTGGSNTITKLLTFESDRTAFRFSTGSFANPANQSVSFKTKKTNFTGSITYASSAFDVGGNYIEPSAYAGTYPGAFVSQNDNGALLNISSFSGSVTSSLIGFITYTASCEGFTEFETIYRFEDGDNAPGVFVTANTNQFIYKATDLSLNPTGQIITIEAKRKNLASATTPLTVNSGSGKPPLTLVSTNATNGVDTYTISGTSYPHSTDETIYSISGSDQFGNVFSDAIKISPIKILDGFSVAVTNENTSFPATSTGTIVGNLAASSGSITVKVGNEAINYSSTFVTNSFSASIFSTSGLTANTFNGTNYSINALSADSGSLNLLVKYKDGAGTIISSSKEITYSKVKKAAPVLSFVIGNNNQTTTAKSTGVQIDTFVTASFTVNETYDGVTTTKTFTPTSITTTNSYQTGSTTSATLALPTMSLSVNSVDISITGSVVDSESTTRFVFGNISLAKAKKAVPNIIVTATPLTQTISATSQSIQIGTLLPVTLDAVEGATSVFNSASIVSSNFTSPSISTNTLTLGSIGNSISAASASISVNFTNSEGTPNNSTILVSATKVNAGNNGATGSAGNTGNDGKRTAANMVHYQTVSATAPATPTATSYTFATNTFTGLTANWGVGAPTYASGNSNKYWYSTYTVVETTAGGGTGTVTFGAPVQAIGFSGLVSFTAANNVGDGTNTLSFGVAGATLINGSNISTGKIISTNYSAGSPFTTAGSIIDLDNGRIATKTFYVDSNGDAVFKGTLSAAAGTFAGNLSAAGGTFTGQITVSGTNYNLSDTLNANTTAGNVGLGNVQNLNAQSQAQTGLISGTTITGGGITLSGGGNIKGGQTAYNTGTGFFLGYSGTDYKFSIGNASTKGITWDGNALSIGGDVSIGVNLASTLSTTTALTTGLGTKISTGAAASDVNNNVTNISGGKIRTGKIQSNNFSGTDDGSGFATAGTSIDLTGGGISAKNFRITAAGDAFFKGDITGASGTFSGTLQIGAETLTAANTLNTQANIEAGLGYTPTTAAAAATAANTATKTDGSVGGWVITSTEIQGGSPTGGGDGSYTTTGIRLGSGGYISAKNFYISSSGNAAFKGDIEATGGTFTGNVTAGDVVISQYGIKAGDVYLSSSGLSSLAGGYGSSIDNYSMFTSRLRLYQNMGQGAYLDSLQFDFLYSASGLTALGVNAGGYVKKVSSSRKYKKDIIPLPLENAKRILNLNIISFKDKDEQDLNTPHAGLVAEEVADLNYTDWVIYDNSGSVDGVYYQSIFASMVKVVQDLNSRIEQLEAKLSGSV